MAAKYDRRLTGAEQRALKRRTTASSRQRYLERIGAIKPAKAPAAKPAPKPAPRPAPVQPLDPAFEAQKVSALYNRQIADARSLYDQGQLDQSYGFGVGGAANPYSQAALLQESFKRAQRGTTNSYASAGQLYSGAYGRMQNENQRNYDIGYDQLRREYDQRSAGIGFDKAQTYADYSQGLDQGAYAALIRALDQQRQRSGF